MYTDLEKKPKKQQKCSLGILERHSIITSVLLVTQPVCRVQADYTVHSYSHFYTSMMSMLQS